jgi:hypothetical protein
MIRLTEANFEKLLNIENFNGDILSSTEAMKSGIDETNERLKALDPTLLQSRCIPNWESKSQFYQSALTAPTDIGNMIGGSTTGTVLPLTTAGKFEIFSGNVNDTVLGSGLRTVLIEGLNNDYEPISEQIDLDGTSAVELVNDYIHVVSAKPVDVGASLAPEGTVIVRRKSDNQPYCSITVNANNDGWFMCPKGYRAVLNHIALTAGNKNGSIRFRIVRKGRTATEVPLRFDNQDAFILPNFVGPILLEGDSAYWLQTANVSASINCAYLLADITCPSP